METVSVFTQKILAQHKFLVKNSIPSKHLPRTAASTASILFHLLMTPLGSGEESRTTILLLHFTFTSLTCAKLSSNPLLLYPTITTLVVFSVWFFRGFGQVAEAPDSIRSTALPSCCPTTATLRSSSGYSASQQVR